MPKSEGTCEPQAIFLKSCNCKVRTVRLCNGRRQENQYSSNFSNVFRFFVSGVVVSRTGRVPVNYVFIFHELFKHNIQRYEPSIRY